MVITQKIARKLSKKLGAYDTCMCSSLTQYNVNNTIQIAAKAAQLARKGALGSQNSNCCCVML